MPIPQIPESYHCITGEDSEGYRRINKFFEDIMDYIGRDTTRPMSSQFERRNFGQIRKDNRQETDDITHMLFYHPRNYSERVVACVAEFRTEFNMVRFDFFRNIQDVSEGENL